MTNTPAALIASLRSFADQEIGDRAGEGDSIIDDIYESYRDFDTTYDFLLNLDQYELRAWLRREIDDAL